MKRHNHTGQIRIISGRWKGRRLSVLSATGLRPTTNRTRETLFNWLASSVIDARCLDCFAGSGALGFEALSRYAASITLLEIKFNVAQQLRYNINILKAVNAKVVNINTFVFLTHFNSVPYNIIFVDPPFRKKFLVKTLTLLEDNGWLADNAFIYVESEIENSLPLISVNWNLYREKITGRVICRLYHYKI